MRIFRTIGLVLILIGLGLLLCNIDDFTAKVRGKKRFPIDVAVVTPLQAYLNSIDGLQILFFCKDHCAPCDARERDTVPWMRENGWTVVTLKNEHDIAELFGVGWYPMFVAVRDHRVVGQSACENRRDRVGLLRAAKADSLDHVGVALANHVGAKSPPAGDAGPVASGVNPSVIRPKPAEAEPMPLLGFPFGPSLSLVDVLQRYAGQEYEINRFARVSIPKGIKWRATKQKNCMHVDIEPPPSLRIFGREVARCTSLDVSFEEISLYLDGFPDFTIPIIW